MVDTILVDDAAEGQRFDRFVTDRLAGPSRSSVQRWIKDGRVTLDGKVLTRPSTRVEAGQTIEVDEPPPRPTDIEPQDIPFSVLHEDEWICVVDKPAGLTVHPGAGRPDGTLANALVHRFRTLSERGGSDRPGIVHRLDRDTSGVMVIARTDEVHHALAAQFEARTIEKEYVAVVEGVCQLDSDWIEGALARDPRNRERMAICEDGRPSSTFYRVERRFKRHTYLRLHPRTGRTHQLRVHLLSLKHPIVADPIYGRRGNPSVAAERLALHAASLTLDHPHDGSRMRFEAPLPADLLALLDACGQS